MLILQAVRAFSVLHYFYLKIFILATYPSTLDAIQADNQDLKAQSSTAHTHTITQTTDAPGTQTVPEVIHNIDGEETAKAYVPVSVGGKLDHFFFNLKVHSYY